MGPETLLKKLPQADRAKAWDAIASATTPEELQSVIDALPFTNYDKAKLWESRTGEGGPPQTGDSGFGVMDAVKTGAAAVPGIGGYALRAGLAINPDMAVNALPAIGGTIGGMAGAAGGMGVGSVPGGIAGATIGGAAGQAAKQTINEWRGVPPQSQLETLKDLAVEGAIQGGSQAVGAGLGAAMSHAAPAVMQSALKPASEYSPKEIAGIVQTLFDEGVNITKGGLLKLQGLFHATNKEIGAIIANSTGRVPKNSVAARLLPVANKAAQQTNPTKALRDVGKELTAFQNHPVYAGPSVSIQEAQRMKMGNYRAIGDEYGSLSSTAIESKKALARGLKEEIVALEPGVAKLNARDSKLIPAIDTVGHRVAVAGNKNPIGFSWVTHKPLTFLASLADRSELFKSLLARGMYNEAGKVAGVAPAVIRAAVVAVASENAQIPMTTSPTLQSLEDGVYEMGPDGRPVLVAK